MAAVAVTVAVAVSVAAVVASTSFPGFSSPVKPRFTGHPLNMDTSLLWTVCFVPEERKPSHFL